MDGVTVIAHPLVQHKLTIMRKKETSTAGFRRLLREISTLLCYEVTRDLEMTMETIDTPLETIQAPVLEGKKLVFASILRAGNGLLEGMLELVPSARIAHVGKVPTEVVRHSLLCGTPDEIVSQAAEWRDCGVRYLVVTDITLMQRRMRKGLAGISASIGLIRGLRRL